MAIMLRLKCPSCGEVMNAAGFCNCTKCGTPIRYNGWGMLQIYRMGSPVSIAAVAERRSLSISSLMEESLAI